MRHTEKRYQMRVQDGKKCARTVTKMESEAKLLVI